MRNFVKHIKMQADFKSAFLLDIFNDISKQFMENWS